MTTPTITIVTGHARCGSSLTMRMLDVGGMPVSCDSKASYEWNDSRWVKMMGEEFSDPPQAPEGHWLYQCVGMAIKCIDPHQFILPRLNGVSYNFVFLSRDHLEQARSILKFLAETMPVLGVRRSHFEIAIMKKGLDQDEPRTMAWLQEKYPDSRILKMRFENLLALPLICATNLSDFLGGNLDVEKMARIVKRRGPECQPGVEIEMQALIEEHKHQSV